MSVHYLIDGYNAVRRVPLFDRQDLQEARESLISFLQREQPQGSMQNIVTIVFDGKNDIAPWPEKRHCSVCVIFTAQESADAYIKRFVADAAARKNIIVVTDDNDIRYYVRNLGAKLLSVRQFFMERTQKKMERSSTGEPKVSKTAEHQINIELEDLWLRQGHRANETKA